MARCKTYLASRAARTTRVDHETATEETDKKSDEQQPLLNVSAVRPHAVILTLNRLSQIKAIPAAIPKIVNASVWVEEKYDW